VWRSRAGGEQWHPAVGGAGDASQDAFGTARSHPERDVAIGTRVDGDAVEPVEPTVEGDERLAEQGSHHLELLLDEGGSVGEGDAERFVLGGVPADADGDVESAARQAVDRGDLLGHERCLALGQDEHAAHELDRGRDRGQVREQGEHLVEGALVGVGRRGERGAGVDAETLDRRAEDVVVGHQVVEAGLVGADGPRPHGVGIGPAVGLGEDGAEVHGEHVRIDGHRCRH
jgi:hypothetical protein